NTSKNMSPKFLPRPFRVANFFGPKVVKKCMLPRFRIASVNIIGNSLLYYKPVNVVFVS
ncbi:hypothetical protein BYT27DRAFT_7115964, partial [Phlegmacium glaucopus]